MAALMRILGLFVHVPGIILAFTLHEFVKAAASKALGDDTPQIKSRLTFNPLKHIEPVGFLLLFFFRLGWGKPVETRTFRYKNRKRDELIVYTLPLLMNLVIGTLLVLAGRFMPLDLLNPWMVLLQSLLINGAYVNICYGLFNILPVSPLDGARILTVLKPELAMKLKLRERVVQMVLMILLCFNLLGQFFGSAATGFMGLFYI